MQKPAMPLLVREAAPKWVFKREGKLEINPLLLQAFGITPEELGDVIKSAEEPEAMRAMFAFLSDYATLSEPGTRLLISGDKLDFLVADMRRRMGRVADFYEYHAKTSGDIEEEERLLKFANKAKQLSRPVGDTRTDKIAYIDAVMGFQHTSGLILPLAFGITDYGREDYWPKKLLAFLRSHGMPGMVREGMAMETLTPKREPWQMTQQEYVQEHAPNFKRFLIEHKTESTAGEKFYIWSDTLGDWIIRWSRRKPTYSLYLNNKLISDPHTLEDAVKIRVALVHKSMVQQAFIGGKPVPPEVIAEYPDIAGAHGAVHETPAPAPSTGKPKINWNLNVREGRIVYMPPEEYMERVNIFNRIGMSRVIEDERRAIGKGYRGIGYYPPLSEQSYKSILEGIRAGNEMDIPNIVYRNRMVDNQEGFHRALVARDIGIEKIPVRVIGEMPSVFIRLLNLRWNENQTEQVKAINALKGKRMEGVFMIRESTDNMKYFISENITPDIENVLRRLEIKGNTVKITEQLDRTLYMGVNQVLERLGGKWNKSAKVHIFPSDPTERINTVLTSGKLEPKIKTGYFPTPPELARRMVEMLDLKPGDKVLEPSAGQGGLLDQLPKGTQVIIGEILPENIQILKQKGYNVNFDNFMGVEIGGVTKVIMNPPFENQQDIEHVTHALRMLQPGGTLVSVMSSGIKFRDNKKTTEFIEMLDRDYYHEIIDLLEGSFKESGTGVGAVLLKVTKPMSTPSTVSSEFVADTTKVNPELAARSHMGTSWDPEKRAQQEILGFAGYVQEVYDNLKPYAKTEAQKAFLDTEIKRFQDSFAKYYNELLARKGQTMSTFITGGSGFNVRRAEKANAAESSKYTEMIEFRDRAKAAILRELKKMAVEEAGGELEVLKKKVADAIRNHEFMVKTNAIVRKKISDDQKIKEIQALAPVSEITVRKLFTPDYMGRIGFPAYALSNDTANIHRMQERVKELEKKEATPSADIEFEGGSIKDNATEDRVQIFFDKKPEQAMIDKLKEEGWRWSPSSGCWQRKRTDQAMWSAERILGIKITRERFVPVKIDPARALYEAIQREKGETAGVKTASFISIIQKLDNLPLRQQEVNRATLLLSSLPNLTLDELIAMEKTVKQWGVTVPQIKDEIEAIYKEYLELRKSEKGQFVSTAPDKLVTIIEKEYDKPVIPKQGAAQTITAPIITAPQPQAVIELRWVYGTQDQKWHLVGHGDRDYYHGISQERMRQIGQEAARAEYLSPAITRAATHAQQFPLEESGDLKKLIFIIEKYVTEGTTYEDFSKGRTLLYLSKSGVKLDPNNIPLKLKDDLRKAGYNSLSELWNDTSRKLRMRMYIPPKHPLMLYPPPEAPRIPLLYPTPVPPEVKKYTTPRTFKKGTIARNNITNEKFVLETDVEALQQDRNAMIWRTNDAHGHYIYIDDQRPTPISLPPKPDIISNDDRRLLKLYENYTDDAIQKRILLNKGKLKELAARGLVRIEKGQYGTMGSAYIEQERLGISQENSGFIRVLELRKLIIAQARPEPWKLTQEEYWRAGAEGKAYEGRGSSDYNHELAVKKALSEHKPVPSEVQRELIGNALEKVARTPRVYGEEYVQAKLRKENEEILARIKAEREQIRAAERIEENELNAELNKLPPALKRHAETEIYGTLHMLDTHKDYHNRFSIALGKVRMIAFAHLPKSEKKEEPAEPLSDYDRVLKAYLENRGYELTLQDFIWADKYTLRGTARHIVASEAEKKRRQDYISKNYNEDVGKKLHRGTVVSALERGIKVPDIVLKDYPDLMKKEVPEPTDYFTLKKAQELSRENKLKLSDEQLREKSIQVQDYIRLIEGTDEYSRKTLIKGGYYAGVIHPDASGKVPVDIWLLQNLKFTLGEFDKEQQRRKQEKIVISVPTVPAAKPVQSIQDIKQHVINSIQEAKSMDELKQILRGLGFLPLPESEKRQLIDLYQIRLSELMGQLKFGERISPEEKKKRRAPQKAVYAPPTRRLEEYGIKEGMRRGYGYA